MDRAAQWSPTGRRPRRWSPPTGGRLAAVLAGPGVVAGLWVLGLLPLWPALGLTVLALVGGLALFGTALSGSVAVAAATPSEGFTPGARVLVVGGGYVGLVAARALQRRHGGDARHGTAGTGRSRAATPVGSITVVDPQPHMTYQPFLPEAAGGAISPRHLTVPLRPVLDGCDVITGAVVAIDDARRSALVELPGGELRDVGYDVLVIAPGAVARELPVPGLTERALSVRTATDATGLRDHVLSRLDAAASTTDPDRRRRLLTFVVVGGGFAGVEALGELEELAGRAGKRIGVDPGELRWVLVEAAHRIMPEVSEQAAARVHGRLTRRGVEVRVGAGLVSAENGDVRLADGTVVATDTIVLAAGTRPHPLLERTDLPLDRVGKLRTTAMLQVVGRPHVFAAGDGAAVPDLARGASLTDENPATVTAPTAQHAVRQAHLLAANLVASLGGRPLRPYYHRSAGVVAGLGRRRGVAEIRGVRLHGWPAWVLHRAYHLWAMPTADRKLRILLDWFATALLGRDPVAVGSVESQRCVVADLSVQESHIDHEAAPSWGVPSEPVRIPTPPFEEPTLREPHPSLPPLREPHPSQPALSLIDGGEHRFRRLN